MRQHIIGFALALCIATLCIQVDSRFYRSVQSESQMQTVQSESQMQTATNILTSVEIGPYKFTDFDRQNVVTFQPSKPYPYAYNGFSDAYFLTAQKLLLDEISGCDVHLHRFPGDVHVFKVERAVEKSLHLFCPIERGGGERREESIIHLSNTDSPFLTPQTPFLTPLWKELRAIDSATFHIPAVTPKEYTRQFHTSEGEFRRQVINFAPYTKDPNYWSAVAKNPEWKANQYFHLTITKVSFRISTLENGDWKSYKRFDFLFPVQSVLRCKEKTPLHSTFSEDQTRPTTAP